MKVIDSHCDTILKMYKGNSINDKKNHITLDNCLKYDKYIQCFAMYMEPKYISTTAFEFCFELIKLLDLEIANNIAMYKIKSRSDLENYNSFEKRCLGVIITIEDGVCLDSKIENIFKLYELGVRMLGLTWNGLNSIAAGVDFSNTKDDGLSKFGYEVIKVMNEINMIIDVSHLSEKSFYNVIDASKKPVMASHSSSYNICNHKRNLKDEQIKQISKNGGIIGLNIYPYFLENNKSKASIESAINHIKYIINVGGKDCIGIGSDFDGIEETPIGLENNSKLFNLVVELEKSGFNTSLIEKIMWQNHYDFFKNNL